MEGGRRGVFDKYLANAGNGEIGAGMTQDESGS